MFSYLPLTPCRHRLGLSVAGAVQKNPMCLVPQAIYSRRAEDLVWTYIAPLFEVQVGCDDDGTAFAALADDFTEILE